MKKFLFITFLIASVVCAAQDSIYKLGPDSQRKDGVPKGTVTKHEWQSNIYHNFREYYIYVPAQYDPSKPAALMVFQDGHSYVNDSGDFRVPIVYVNLIHHKKLRVSICLFVYRGHIAIEVPN